MAPSCWFNFYFFTTTLAVSETMRLISRFHWMTGWGNNGKIRLGVVHGGSVLHQHVVCDERVWAGGFSEPSCRTWSLSPAGRMPMFFLLSFVLVPLCSHIQNGWIFALLDGVLTVCTSPLSLHTDTDKFILKVWCRDNECLFSYKSHVLCVENGSVRSVSVSCFR